MRDGTLVAQLVPFVEDHAPKRKLGWAAGQVRETPGWEKALTAEEVAAFLGASAWVAHLKMQILPIEAAHAYAVYGLPMLHKDPFDRILIAQALVEDLVLVTSDEDIQRSPQSPTLRSGPFSLPGIHVQKR